MGAILARRETSGEQMGNPTLIVAGLALTALGLLEEKKVRKAFISFDYDNDEFLRTALVGQARHPDTPFEIIDRSVKDHLPGDWKSKVRGRIQRADLVVVMCGEYTHTARGVAVELEIAQELGKPYFLLRGYSDRPCTRPTAARAGDKIYNWTWDNLKLLIDGSR